MLFPLPPLEIFSDLFPLSKQAGQKMQVNEANIVKIYLYMDQILLYNNLFWQLKLLSTTSIFGIKIKSSLKLSKMIFIAPKNSFCSQDFRTFALPSSSLFSFLGHCWFYGRSWLMINAKVYGIIMSLNWILKTQIL